MKEDMRLRRQMTMIRKRRGKRGMILLTTMTMGLMTMMMIISRRRGEKRKERTINNRG